LSSTYTTPVKHPRNSTGLRRTPNLLIAIGTSPFEKKAVQKTISNTIHTENTRIDGPEKKCCELGSSPVPQTECSAIVAKNLENGQKHPSMTPRSTSH
jgi:hypothetical protein